MIHNMDYEQSIKYIHSLNKFGIKPGLERITSLCRAFGNPQNSLKFIHVAGTNGKGSTSTMLSGIFRAAGCKTGLFISPYVVDFRERIQTDGKMIPKKRLAEIITRIKPAADELAAENMQPTEFEVITAAAFVYFAEESCEVVVLEAGLGGRLDSTNVIDTPLSSVITSVSLDHTGVLGSTIAEIAAEKCGIIKENGITVSYPLQIPEAERVIRETAKSRRNLYVVPELKSLRIIDESLEGTRALYGETELFVPFIGRHMVYNAVTAATAAFASGSDSENGFDIREKHIIRGIASAAMPARMEVLSTAPPVIIDGGHNEGCAAALRDTVMRFLRGKRITAICGMMADKDYRTYLELTVPLFERFIAVTPENPRSLEASKLAAVASGLCPLCMSAESVESAVQTAFDGNADAVIACGSFYMMEELRPLLCEKLKNFNRSP